MDVRNQQIVVQQHMNDRLAEARMARLASESRAAARGFEQERTRVARHAPKVHRPSALGGLLAGLFEAAATIGSSLAPTPPLRVRVVRR